MSFSVRKVCAPKPISGPSFILTVFTQATFVTDRQTDTALVAIGQKRVKICKRTRHTDGCGLMDGVVGRFFLFAADRKLKMSIEFDDTNKVYV